MFIIIHILIQYCDLSLHLSTLYMQISCANLGGNFPECLTSQILYYFAEIFKALRKLLQENVGPSQNSGVGSSIVGEQGGEQYSYVRVLHC